MNLTELTRLFVSPKSSQGSPIKFYVRRSKRMKFKLDPNPIPFLNRRETATSRYSEPKCWGKKVIIWLYLILGN